MSLLQKWVDALESGKYKQAKEELISDTWYDETIGEYVPGPSYCCLGVLTKVAPKKANIHGAEDEELLEPAGFAKAFRLRKTKAVKEGNLTLDLDPQRVEEFGVPSDPNYVQNILAKMNDGGSSFKDIAKWIKTNLKDA